jgi:hypothetical protein
MRRLTAWMSRARAAVLAELRLVDCGSLDVLLFCADDVAFSGPPAAVEVEGAV